MDQLKYVFLIIILLFPLKVHSFWQVFIPVVFPTFDSSNSEELIKKIRWPFYIKDPSFVRAEFFLESLNFNEARSIYEDLALKGMPQAYNRLGLLYDRGLGVKQDKKMAFDYYLKSAELGLPEGQVDAGRFYDTVLFNPPDPKTGCDWFEKAALQNLSYGIFELSFCFYKGEGRAQDYFKAFEYAKKAAEFGNASAQLLVGIMLARGQGCVQDKVSAQYYLERSAEQGISYAKKMLREFKKGKRI